MTSIDLSENINSLGWINPFSGCTSLREINIDLKNANFKSVNGIVYTISGEELVVFPNQAIYTDAIFDGVKIINAGALYGNNTIENIILPETIDTIEDYVFYNVKSLKICN